VPWLVKYSFSSFEKVVCGNKMLTDLINAMLITENNYRNLVKVKAVAGFLKRIRVDWISRLVSACNCRWSKDHVHYSNVRCFGDVVCVIGGNNSESDPNQRIIFQPAPLTALFEASLSKMKSSMKYVTQTLNEWKLLIHPLQQSHATATFVAAVGK